MYLAALQQALQGLCSLRSQLSRQPQLSPLLGRRRAGVNYLSTKIGGEKVNIAAKLALTVVRALEQQGELLGFDGPHKKEMAIVMLR